MDNAFKASLSSSSESIYASHLLLALHFLYVVLTEVILGCHRLGRGMHEDTDRGNKAHWVPHIGRAEPRTNRTGSMIRFTYRVYWGILPRRIVMSYVTGRLAQCPRPCLCTTRLPSTHVQRLATTFVPNCSLFAILTVPRLAS